MLDDLHAYEVLEIAVRVEEKGERFYRKAAVLLGQSKESDLLIQLADWERQHKEMFLELRNKLARQEWDRGSFEPIKIQISEAQVIAALAVFGIHPNPESELSGKESRDELINIAVKKEKDSITFYQGIKDRVLDPSDRDLVDKIIAEEQHHVRILSQALEH